MRKNFSNKKIILYALILLFFMGQLSGSFLIKTMFINYKIKELSPRLEYIADEIGSGEYLFSRNNDFILKAYDLYGHEMNLFDEIAHEDVGISEANIQKSLEKYVPKLIAGQKVALLEQIEGQNAESILIGAPIIKNNEVIGVVFMLKPASDFKAVLNGFYLVFSLTLIIGSGFILLFLFLYMKEMKGLEQTRREYIANISHELKSPIASIKALTETLADQMVTEEDTKQRYYGIILKESSYLQRLISDMLELSRLQSGKVAFQKEQVNAKTLLNDVYEKYSLLATELDICFEITDLAFDMPPLYTNRDRVLQIFTILLDNAIKFVKEDGSIKVDAEIHGKYVKFFVQDNGIGIDKEIKPFIFERFYKGNYSKGNQGSGLGLSIAKEIALGLGETISLSESSEKVTVFEFTVQRFF